MKTLTKVWILALLAIGLMGCSSPTKIYENQTITQEESIYATRYDSFTGSDSIDIVVEESSNVVIEVETLGGSLDIVFVQKNDIKRENPFIEEKDIQTSQLEGVIDAGEYQLVVYGENHQGGYGIKYE